MKPLSSKAGFKVYPNGHIEGFKLKRNHYRVSGISPRQTNKTILVNDRILVICQTKKIKAKKIKPAMVLLATLPGNKCGIDYFVVDYNLFWKCFNFRGNPHTNKLFLIKREELKRFER